MKKLFTILLLAAMLTSLISCVGESVTETSVESKLPTVKDLYKELTSLTKKGHWDKGLKVYELNKKAFENHKKAPLYKSYCEAMRAYEAGGISTALEHFKACPDLLDSPEYITEIEAVLSGIEGTYKTDNGAGSYLYVFIKNGKVQTKVVGYDDDSADLAFDEETFSNSLLRHKYTDGKETLAIGRYSGVDAKITVDYVINTFDDTTDIALVAFEGAKYTTFNGVYSKLG